MRSLLIIFTLLWTVLAHSQTAGQLQMDQWDGTNWRALTVTPGTSGQMLTWGASNTITSTTLTKSLIGLSAVENTALSTWPGSTSITTLATVANPSWLTSLPWSKITSAPSFITGNQTITISGAISGSGTTSISTVLGSNQARDNLTGGNGSLNLSGFTLTLPSSYPTATPTKGHILVGNGTAWLPLTVGTNTHVLTADSVESLGVKWAAPSAAIDPLVTISSTGGYGRIGLYDDDAGVFRYLEATSTGRISFPSAVEAGFYYGNGSALTNLNAANITTGTLPTANGGVHPLVTTGDNGSGYGRIGLWDADNTDWLYFSAGSSKIIFPDIQAASFSGSGSSITGINASNISTGQLPAANGGTGLASSGTAGNVLTSNGTTWTSTAPATTNPAGSGSELQFRSSGTAFGAVSGSSVSSGAITLGIAEDLRTTSVPKITVRNTTAATAVLTQVSPSIVFEGRGWKTDATAASQIVRFRENILPVNGTANPSATWRLQSEINNSGTWTDRVTMTTPGVFAVSGDSNTITLDAKDSNNNISAIRHINITPGNGWNLFLNASTQVQSLSTFGFGSDVVLARDAANTLAQRNSTANQVYRLYEVDSGANDEYLELSAAAGTNLIRPQATGTGVASTVRYHTTPTVWFGSGSGSPEGVATASIGSLYTDTTNGLLYRKTSGTGSTGWVNP